ncbi:MAG: hypothetical protein DRI39_02650 [Chloroflexi bacterium]|nr:MAG: hypothetical protein DRI39_02650 [Chloroflexota bacterium]
MSMKTGHPVVCRVCGSPLYPGRAVFRCSCGANIHSSCWEKHVLQSHKPSFVVGTINLDGEFKPKEAETADGKWSVERGAISAGKKQEFQTPAEGKGYGKMLVKDY